jgi:hypothetical protein
MDFGRKRKVGEGFFCRFPTGELAFEVLQTPRECISAKKEWRNSRLVVQ